MSRVAAQRPTVSSADASTRAPATTDTATIRTPTPRPGARQPGRATRIARGASWGAPELPRLLLTGAIMPGLTECAAACPQPKEGVLTVSDGNDTMTAWPPTTSRRV